MYAQDKSTSLPTINAEGTGKMTVAPDWVTTYLTINSKGMDYNKVVQDLNNKASALEKQLIMAGFRKEDLKTTSYTINKNIVWDNNRNIDSGFIAQQSFVLEYPNNNQKIASFVKAISEGKSGASFNFGFGLSEKKNLEVTSELIRKAVTDATQKARILAEANGVKLKRIYRISYGKPEIPQPIPYQMDRAMMKSEGANEFTGFNVQDIKLTDSVNITWEIE
jgi:uncharacterized protein YggE